MQRSLIGSVVGTDMVSSKAFAVAAPFTVLPALSSGPGILRQASSAKSTLPGPMVANSHRPEPVAALRKMAAEFGYIWSEIGRLKRSKVVSGKLL